MTKPLRITTTTHAMVLAVYLASATQGVWFVNGLASARGLTELFGEPGLDYFGLVQVVTGVLALAAALVAPWVRVPIGPLMAEAVGVGFVALLNGVYWWTLHRQGWDFAVSTQTYAFAFALGGAARLFQIVREVLKLKRGRVNPQPANPAPLADPARG